jgi:hypothetical protein
MNLRLLIGRSKHSSDDATRKIKIRNQGANRTPPGELIENDVFFINSPSYLTKEQKPYEQTSCSWSMILSALSGEAHCPIFDSLGHVTCTPAKNWVKLMDTAR